jgi:hypothetical protein
VPVEPARPSAPAARKPSVSSGRTVAPVHSVRTTTRENGLTDWAKLFSLGAVMRGWYADAGAISEHGPKLAHEIALMAESNEQFAKYCDYLTETGPIMGIASAFLPLALQLLANHGRIDASKLPPEAGIVKPELLEKKVRAEMELANAQILKKIQEITQEAEKTQRELIGSQP